MLHRTRHPRRGVALVEVAVVLPVLLTLVLGVWEVGRMLEVRHCLTMAAREAARQAATGPSGQTEIVQAARDALSATGLPGEHAEVRLTDAAGQPANPYDMASGDALHIEVTLPFRHTRYTTLRLVTGEDARLTARSVWCLHSELD
jgi:Flp pilus assembly protein TadG